ncbi:2-dehydropantoate 2-reductase [Endozoicomonas sp. G2_2]|uniref:ketopantoate reductase family protein n=1 Tax=Endozoicomonas sp. G2_2 TaxID=2821092 RepID=UPI001AD9E29C|nr:2-dehydropantoate 2-reductase [Endozoicomonas sp. G2_2]MBO9471334.1 2-dehydropantoate 2-reductase [Endozoicomonas sp. G2_2]
MSTAASSAAPPHWHLVGAGHIGTLAAAYVRAAGHGVTVVRPHTAGPIKTTLAFADGRPLQRLTLPTVTPTSIEQPISHLLVACKTPYTRAALAPLPLAATVTAVRLQNGIGSLDGLLPSGARLIDAVTTSAVKGTRAHHDVVAENTTWFGDDGAAPDWFDGLRAHWPNLEWSASIRRRQWQKLVANAAINPLTALHDVPNGALIEDAALHARMRDLVAEADSVLGALDDSWPGDSLAAVAAIARATAGNTSSMRADVQRDAPTEIEAINGWLLRAAAPLGLALPAHRAVFEALRAR